MLRTVGICVLVVIILLVGFALMSRFNWNPLDRLATPPPTAASAGVPPSAVPGE